ncbi:MAG: ATP-binding cassette domain-containing protein, partial [Lachnospiraceae bacterium]|nr:ATP-binding cassette domain-containing protein [Lachnospiraceae bacterium]
MGIIKVKDLIFEYIRRGEEGNVAGRTAAVENVNLDINQGDFVAVLGHNGSGKSTFSSIAAGIQKHDSGVMYL